MKTTAVTDFKSHALQILALVAERRESVLVTKRGKPLAQVIPYAEKKPAAGALSEAFVFEKDIVSPLGAGLWSACT